jgi:2-desacetyl-2-hydroxyethyl bacteriochlorophyllide A dehydrogenase
MKAALVGEGGTFDLATVPDPVPQAGELLLRVTACGLCGSDLKARGAFPVGTVMGHEFGGQVVGMGPNVTGWRKDMHAAVLPVVFCGTCDWCQRGDVVHCSAAQLVGLGGRPGGFAELVVVPAASSFSVPVEVDPVHTALVEPYAVGLHCVQAAAIARNEHVLVIGSGAVGLTTIAWARQRGASRITVVDPVATRRLNAMAFGATDALTEPAEAAPNEYDVAVECVGKPGLLDACIASVRPKGRIVVAGTCVEPDPFWSVAGLLKEVTIRFAVYYSPAEFRTVIDAFTVGEISPDLLVGKKVALGALNDAFAEFAASSITGKILIQP